MRAIVFTDLDGTLLDHDTYSYAAARPALSRLTEIGAPLILVTSKTRAEVEVLHRELDLEGPFVTENGGGVFFPDRYGKYEIPGSRAMEGYTALVLGRPYNEVRDFLEAMQLRYPVEGFGDMSLQRISELTGLSTEQARLAARREFTEPFLIENEQDLDPLRQVAARQGFSITTGGRFHHLIGEHQDKGRAVEAVSRILGEAAGDSVVTVGLGDSANDLPMLESVEIPIVIPRLDGHTLQPARSETVVASQPGSAGWNGVILELLSRLYSSGD